MKNKTLLSIFTFLYSLPLSLHGIEINQQSFNARDGFTLTTSEETIRLGWGVAADEAFIELQFIPRQGNNPAAPLIKSLGINQITIMENYTGTTLTIFI